MKRFRENKTEINPRQEAVAGRIAGRIVRFQTRIAAYLNGRTGHFTRKAKLLLLIVFCLLLAAVNLCLLISSITHYS